jgi:hypothetical protein
MYVHCKPLHGQDLGTTLNVYPCLRLANKQDSDSDNEEPGTDITSYGSKKLSDLANLLVALCVSQ